MSADDVLRPWPSGVTMRRAFASRSAWCSTGLRGPRRARRARALEIVRAHHVDVVLLDIRLPRWTASRCFERLKALTTARGHSGHRVKTVRTAVAAMKLGAFDYLTKPFEDEELLSLARPRSRSARSSAR